MASQHVEFVLPFNTHLLITSPPNRATVPSGEPFPLCFRVVLGAMCVFDQSSEDFSGAATVRVDGQRVAVVKHVDAGEDDACVEVGVALVWPMSETSSSLVFAVSYM